MQMHYPSASYIIARCRLLPHMHVEPQDGGEPPLHVLEGKGKHRSCLLFPRLGPGCFVGLDCQNSASRPALTCSAQDRPSPALPVSMGAGVSERDVSEVGASATGASATEGSSAGVS